MFKLFTFSTYIVDLNIVTAVTLSALIKNHQELSKKIQKTLLITMF